MKPFFKLLIIIKKEYQTCKTRNIIAFRIAEIGISEQFILILLNQIY